MSKDLHVATSPLTNRIYTGRVLKDGCTWGSNKTDVTGEACAAVAHHVLANGEPVTVTRNGVPAYRITVEDLTAGEGVENVEADAYAAVADMIAPHVTDSDGGLPGSVIESVGILLEHWLKTRAAPSGDFGAFHTCPSCVGVGVVTQEVAARLLIPTPAAQEANRD